MVVPEGFLKSTAYFSGLSPAELDSIRKFAFEKAAGRGEVILLEGEPANELYFVVSGVVKVFKTSDDGREQTLYLVRPGGSFNDVPVFGSGLNVASAAAMGPVALCGIKRSNLEVILHEHPQVSLNAIQVLSQLIRHLLSLVEGLSFKHVDSRVARILLEHAGDGTGSGPRLTQQEMAAMAGTAREMVGRSLKALEEDGVIKLDRHRIIITDRKALGEIAGVTA